tara:strand:- start:329 stop:463 length:135 start_codon:yes stop_codon:yes gene_type:complete
VPFLNEIIYDEKLIIFVLATIMSFILLWNIEVFIFLIMRNQLNG